MERMRILWITLLALLPLVAAGCGLAGLGSTAGAAYAALELLDEEEEDEDDPVLPDVLAAAVAGTGPVEGRVTALASDAAVVYAGTYRAGIFKSTDSGATWTASNTGFNRNLSVSDLVLDPADATQVFAATGKPFAGGVFVTSDGGTTWTASNTGFIHVDIRCLAMPATGTIYAGTGGTGVFVGTVAAGAVTWVQAGTTGLNNLFITDIVVSGTDFFVSTAGGGVFYHDDSTSPAPASWTWAAANTGLGNLDVLSLGIYANSDLWAGTNGGGIYYGALAGGPPASWALQSAGTIVYEIGVSQTTNQNLWIATDSGVDVSTDGGGTWGAAGTLPDETVVRRLILHSTDGASLYAAGYSGGVYSSANSGTNWTAGNTSLIAGDFAALAVDPGSVGNTVVFGGNWVRETTGSSRGVYSTINNGSTWSNISDGTTLDAEDIRELIVDPTDSSTIYAAVWSSGINGIYKSTSGGSIWTSFSTGLGSARVYALAIDSATVNNLYACTDLGIYRSTDGGAFWNAGVTTQPPAGRATLALTGVTGIFQNGETVTGGTSLATGTVRSGGGTTTLVVDSSTGAFQASEGLSGSTSLATATVNTVTFQWFFTDILVDPAAPTTVWCTLDGPRGGVYTSSDSGVNWAAAAGQPGSSSVTCLERDPQSTVTVYAGTSDAGMFRSVDSGATWASMNTNVGTVGVMDILADERSAASGSHYLFAATTRGLFRSEDRGTSWNEIINVAPVNPLRPEIKAIEKLGLDPLTGNEKMLWAATGGRGILKITLP